MNKQNLKKDIECILNTYTQMVMCLELDLHVRYDDLIMKVLDDNPNEEDIDINQLVINTTEILTELGHTMTCIESVIYVEL